MSTAKRLHPALWDSIKNDIQKGTKGGPAGKWSARKAQLAVLEYKKQSMATRGNSGYHTPKPSSSNSLAKWTREDWGYAGAPGNSRYLPAVVRNQLTPSERRRENSAKAGKKGRNIPYSNSVKHKMRAADVF